MEQSVQKHNPNLVLDVDESPKKVSQWFLFALQHILAMLVACITVPLLTGLPIAATLLSAGLGTLLYILITKKKSPVFLSSSFAYISPMVSALGVGLVYQAGGATAGDGRNYFALILGMLMVGLVYVAVALVVKFVGTKWLNKLLPPIVVGPVIMVIGLSLSGSAINNLVSSQAYTYNLLSIFCGLAAMVITACCSHYGKGKMISLIPFVIGMASGYVLASIFTAISYAFPADSAAYKYMHLVDWTPLTSLFTKENISFASFINYKMFVPDDPESFMFLRVAEIKAFDWGKFGEIALLFIPVAFVTICEHIGDHENLGNIIGRDLLNGEPGMTRTLTGDGIATAVSGALCGAANTTYGENVAVVGTTRIASTKVVMLAAIMSIGIAFLTPVSALLATIPGCITGGVSLILYGFIAASGVQMLIKNQIDFTVSKNMYIASVILVSGIGGLSLKFGNPEKAPVITITSIAVAMLLGIFMNSILKTPKNPEGTEAVEEAKLIEKEKRALGIIDDPKPAEAKPVEEKAAETK